METIVYLQFFSVAARSEGRINDIPLIRAHPGEQNTMNIPVRQYLLPGRNVIELRAQPGGQPFPDGAEMILRLAEFTEEDWLEFDEGSEFAAIRPVLTPATPVPFIAAATLDLGTEYGRAWAWSQAPVLSEADHRGALDAYAGQLSDMFAARDATGLLAQAMVPLSEDAAAYPRVPLEARQANFRQIFDLPPGEEWKPQPFDPRRIVYRSAAGGRLVELLGADGLPYLRTWAADPARPFETPGYSELRAFVGIRDGRFAILR